VLSRDGYRCYLCRKKCKKTFEYNDPLCATVDMVVPASKGGDWEYYNLRCACRQCNSRKSNRLIGQLTLRMATDM
jgi:5-methylcytosine-specific restriction endonuclease McrA